MLNSFSHLLIHIEETMLSPFQMLQIFTSECYELSKFLTEFKLIYFYYTVHFFFSSNSGYRDELVWAALWLYKATGTSNYLTYATTGYTSYGFSGNNDVLSWDLKVAGIKVIIAQLTGQASYIQDVANLCNSHMATTRSPLGEAFFSQWGSLRYAANAGYLCLLVSKLIHSDNKN
jgi:hypothetical protein